MKDTGAGLHRTVGTDWPSAGEWGDAHGRGSAWVTRTVAGSLGHLHFSVKKAHVVITLPRSRNRDLL